jgi:hypothetical protein
MDSESKSSSLVVILPSDGGDPITLRRCDAGDILGMLPSPVVLPYPRAELIDWVRTFHRMPNGADPETFDVEYAASFVDLSSTFNQPIEIIRRGLVKLVKSDLTETRLRVWIKRPSIRRHIVIMLGSMISPPSLNAFATADDIVAALI